MRPILSVFDTGMGPDLIRKDVSDPCWLDNIRQRDMFNICGAFNFKLNVSGTLIFHRRVGEARTSVNCRIVSDSLVPVLLRTTYTDRFIKQIHPAKRKMVLYQDTSVSILVVHDAGEGAIKTK